MLRADDIVNARFTKVFRGYDIQEVDLFLDEVIDTLDGLEEERDTLLSRLEALLEELERCDALLELHNIRRPELEENTPY
ncbi:MAG TPA: DivIVA domain-containing protein [Feifaniaceae bacterium]|nr:DivIVA domain-containing protein [Feifaniaceae bacterium]